MNTPARISLAVVLSLSLGLATIQPAEAKSVQASSTSSSCPGEKYASMRLKKGSKKVATLSVYGKDHSDGSKTICVIVKKDKKYQDKKHAMYLELCSSKCGGDNKGVYDKGSFKKRAGSIKLKNPNCIQVKSSIKIGKTTYKANIPANTCSMT